MPREVHASACLAGDRTRRGSEPAHYLPASARPHQLAQSRAAMRIAQKKPSVMYSIVVQSRCMGDACALADYFAGEGLTRRLQADYKYERYAPSVRVLRTCRCKFDWSGIDHQRTRENRLCVKRCDGRVKPTIGRETARRSCQPGSNDQLGPWDRGHPRRRR